jgi:upstream activation factor subunit UAF30
MAAKKKSKVKSKVKPKVKAKAKPKAKAKKSTAKRKPNPSFMKPVRPDSVLAAVVGSNPMPRTELTKKLWDYIKKNKLQDAKVRTQINADDALRAVFNGRGAVSMFEMTKLVSNHLVD